MKRLLFVILAAAAIWAGYWAIGAYGVRSGFEAWFQERRDEGWVAETASITTRGFPNRFDTTLTDLTLADPDTGLAYSAPFLQIFALSYRPQHLIAIWPDQQSLQSPFGKVQIESSDMRASLIVAPGSALALERSNFVAAELSAALENGERYGAKSVNMAMARTDAANNRYHFGIDAREVTLPQPSELRLETGGLLPESMEVARGDVSITFDAPWDLDALQHQRPQPRQIDIKLIEARWGQLELKLAGGFDVDALGRADGSVTIKAQNWRDILTLANATGALPDALVRPIEQALSLLAGLSGNKQTLDLPLTLSGGTMKLGPIPLGPAPVFKLR